MVMPDVKTTETDIAVIGGGLGGVAAALAACEAGWNVVLTEETAWLGGQVTSQAVSALDEHERIETVCGTRTYKAFRDEIRRHYQERYGVPALMPDSSPLNPGNGWVSRLCFEPRVGLKVIQEMLEPPLQSGKLRLLLRYRPTVCEGDPMHIRSVQLTSWRGEQVLIRARWFLDATELGDLLPLAGVPYVTGAEAVEDTGERHASQDGPRPGRVQSFTFGFIVEFCPGENHTIRKPHGYERFKVEQPYSLILVGHKGEPIPFSFFKSTSKSPLPFWTYRRLLDGKLLDPLGGMHDMALINWASNDYRWGNIIDKPAHVKALLLDGARRLSLGFLYWLQTEAPRDDGAGYGYPELRLMPEAVGTRSGLSMGPYIREARRIKGLKRILEQDISSLGKESLDQAAFPDSCGIGWYPIDLHPCVGDGRSLCEGSLYTPTLPYQIPLGALVPAGRDNLLAACKNISTTHITNGAFRLHPVEWSIGEAAGSLAAWCCERHLSPERVWGNPEELRAFQAYLRGRGVDLEWPDSSFSVYPNINLCLQ
jgi:hypothetical protein